MVTVPIRSLWFPRPFMETRISQRHEDHDFEEINHFFLGEQKVRWEATEES